MEKKIIRALLQHEFYEKHSPQVFREYFSTELANLFDLIKEQHETNEADIDLDDIAELYTVRYPLTTSNRDVFNIIIDQIRATSVPNTQVMLEILASQKRKHLAREIISEAVNILNTGKGSFENITNLSKGVYHADQTVLEELTETNSSLRDIFTARKQHKHISFPIVSLQKRIEGAGPGNSIAVFGRPEAGKTSFVAHFTASLLRQQKKVAYFANEEPASSVIIRIACAALQKTEREIQALSSKSDQGEWGELRKYLSLFDATGYSLEHVDHICAKRVPEIVILDQTDKFVPSSPRGAYAHAVKDYEKLGLLWSGVRVIAKRRNVLCINVTQASADAIGKRHVTYDQMARSKTDKGAEVDLAIGIGMNPSSSGVDDGIRYLTISKNKLSGWHGIVPTTFIPETCTFME